MKTKPSSSALLIASPFFFALLLSGCPPNDNALGTDGCLNDGKLYQTGQTVALDACTSCVCQSDGTVGKCTNTCQADGGPDTGSGGNAEAVLSFDLATFDFGTLPLGQSAAVHVVVTNTGTAPSGSLAISPGANVTATGCADALAAMASCTLTLTATPTVAGSFNSQVSLSASPGTVTPIVIIVTGNGIQPGQFSATPSVINMGTVTVGGPAVRATVTVTAEMTALTGLSASIDDPELSIVENSCTTDVAAGATCAIVVGFVATTTGAKSATLVLSSSGKTVSIQVMAVAEAPAQSGQFSATPAVIDMGTVTVGGPAVRSTITVTATTPLPGLTVSVTSTELSIVEDTCTGLAAGTCTIVVGFTATTSGAKSGTVVVSAGGKSVAIPVVAIAQPAAQSGDFSVAPAAINLGTVKVGGPAVKSTITVTATPALTALTVSVTAPELSIVEDTCTGVTAGGTCTIVVSLATTTPGAKSYAVVLTSAGGKTLSVPVTAIAQAS